MCVSSLSRHHLLHPSLPLPPTDLQLPLLPLSLISSRLVGASLTPGSAVVYTTGDPDAGIWSAGICIGLINDVPTCGALLSRMEREVEEQIGGLGKLVGKRGSKL